MGHGETTAYEQALASMQREEADLKRQLEAYDEVRLRLQKVQMAISALRRLMPRGGNDTQDAAPPVLAPATATGPGVILGGHLRLKLGGTPKILHEAAQLILRELRRPAHIREIIEKIQERGWYADRSVEQLRTSLVPTLNRKAAAGDTFTKDASGSVYGLLEWKQPN